MAGKKDILSQLKSLKNKIEEKKARLQELGGQRKQLLLSLKESYNIDFTEIAKYIEELEDRRAELMDNIDKVEEELIRMLESRQ